MLRILFVYDEPNILSATRRATRSMREVWDVHFVDNGQDALALLAETAVDVVVSDMRMAEMDGAELLERVRTISPSTARIMMSGYAEEEAVFRSTAVAHQFLSKPCDLEQLVRTIEDIRASRDTVEPEAIRELVGRIEQLPALGDVYRELSDAIGRDTASNETLGRIVARDVALTAELLRLINSAFFGLSRRVDSVAQAIGFLGIDVVRAIVAGHSLFSTDTGGIIDIDGVAARGQAVAALARTAIGATGVSATVATDAYTAGLLHEIGVLVLTGLSDIPADDLRTVLEEGDITNERLMFGADRFSVGSYLLGLWGFTPSVVQAVSALGQPPTPDADPVVRSVRLAYEMVANGWAQLDGQDADGEHVLSLLEEAEMQLRQNGHLAPLNEEPS